MQALLPRMLKIKCQLKPELFLFGINEKTTRNSHGRLFLYMMTAERLLDTYNELVIYGFDHQKWGLMEEGNGDVSLERVGKM